MRRMLVALGRSLRPHQWVKNLFVLAPLVFAHRADDPAPLARALAAFGLFCAAASAIYLVNDVRDREADRRHPLKAKRPIAAGELPAGVATAAAVALAGGAVAGALALGPRFFAALAGYVALNLLYSFALKHIVILDAMSIAAGFMIRVLGGAAAIDVAISRWLLLCGSFLALFLAFSKRRHELVLLAAGAADQRRVLADYGERFLDQMIGGMAASTVVSYALWAADPDTAARLGTPHLLWTLPMVLYGVFRFLYLAHQRDDQRNPTEAILTDPPFLANFALWALLVTGLIYGL
jgi:decaprenyl-phosphate phosphoribosyltransferase